MIRLLLTILAAALLALGYSLWMAERADKRADVAESELAFATAANDALVETLEIERYHAQDLARIAAEYEQDKIDAQAAADRVVADLRADNLRLSKRWAGCPAVPQAAATAGQPDAAADDRAESAGRIVRAAAECDAQVRGLQAIVLADRSAP